jgi:signal transduction histidine kinase
MTRGTRLWLLVVPAALAVGAAAAILTSLSDHQDVPRLQAVLAALTGWSFITAGLIARTRRPRNRTGLLLIAVGFTWLVAAALIGSNDSLAWTLGVAVSAVPAAFLIHLLIAYPSGQLESRWELLVVVTGYALVTVANVAHLPFDPDPVACAPDCPENAFFVRDSEMLRVFTVTLVQLFAVVYLLAVVGTLVGRWRRSSPAARRALAPVLSAGAATLLLLAIAVGLEPFSESMAEVLQWTASIVLIGVPFLFLWGLLQTRLARADIGRALAEQPGGGVQQRVRELLRDATAEVLYVCDEPSPCYLDVDGHRRDPAAEPGRALTPIVREGRELAAILHDEALLEEPELLEQVAAAVGLEVERDQNLFELQASERRSRALVEAMPDNMFRISRDGVFLDIQETPAGSTRPVQADVGSSVYDYPVSRELIDRVMTAGWRALDTGELQTIEWTLDLDKVLYQEGRFMPSGDDEFFLVVRDVTDRKQREVEQAALHRVALAVASEARPEQIFDLVSEEVARVLGADTGNLVRYEPGRDGPEALIVGGWRKAVARGFPIGDRFPLEGTTSEITMKTGHPARREHGDPGMAPWLADEMEEMNVQSLIAAPITLTGRPWGAAVATLTAPNSFPPGAEERLSAFTRLVSLALANEEARGELAASRARLVSAGDEERRRLERNLHDGAQQRLVSVSVNLRLAQAKLTKGEPGKAATLMSEAGDELGTALEELRELARGIHPAVLTERGLGPALNSLADRAPLPVSVDGLPEERLPDHVETAAYYVVSEALANVAKYARASSVDVRVDRRNGRAVIEVIDDGVGGANPRLGSGLHGLADRVEALDGHLRIHSPPGKGTVIRAEIPCR